MDLVLLIRAFGYKIESERRIGSVVRVSEPQRYHCGRLARSVAKSAASNGDVAFTRAS